MKRIFYIFLLFLLPAFSLSGTSPTDNSGILDEVIAAGSAMQSLECDFVQSRHISMLSSDAVSSGHLFYSQPDRLRWEYVAPEAFVFALNGSNVAMMKDGKTVAAGGSGKKMFREIARMMMNNLSGRTLNDGKSFKAEASAAGREWIVTLVPVKNEIKQFLTKFVMHFDPAAKLVVKVEMFEQSGDSTTIEFSNHRINRTLDSGLFSLD